MPHLIRPTDGTEGKEEGRKEGRKGGRKEGRMEGKLPDPNTFSTKKPVILIFSLYDMSKIQFRQNNFYLSF